MNHTSSYPETGGLIIAKPTLLDPNFARSVILLCDRTSEGDFGLVLNRPLTLTLKDVVKDVDGWDAPLSLGGPVQPETLHLIHCRSDLDFDSKELTPGVYWGGNFDALSDAVTTGKAYASDFRFFIGYSGWGDGQLAEEIESNSWYVSPSIPDITFADDTRNVWRQALSRLGPEPEFAMLANFPDDPQFN